MKKVLEKGLFLESITNIDLLEEDKCCVCNKQNIGLRYQCIMPIRSKKDIYPEFDTTNIKYWRNFFMGLRSVIYGNTKNEGSLLVCSKKCWKKMIEPVKADILVYICKLDNKTS